MTKTLVTDGQLATLATRQNELFARVRRGAYASVDEVLGQLQVLIEGRAPNAPKLSGRLMSFRKFTVGGIGIPDLLTRVQMICTVHPAAIEMFGNDQFETQENEEEIETINMGVYDFCPKDPNLLVGSQLLNPEWLAEWSGKNRYRLPEGRVLDLLPAEAGPHIRDQYRDEPEYLGIAMKPLRGEDDEENEGKIFVLDKEDGIHRLTCARVMRGVFLPPYERFIYRLIEA